MGLLDVHADSIERNALRAAANPGPDPGPSFSLWATGRAAVKSVPAGLLEGVGAIRDLSRHMDQTHIAERKAMAERFGTYYDPSKQFVMPSGDAQRKKADEFMPDPLTAHTAEQMVGGFGKTLTKAAVAMTVAGPVAGAGLFGLGEADDTAQRLQAKGVDKETAWQVGGVVGAVSAVGAGLPISGAALANTVAGKIGATAAFATVGGPVAFMAQEKLSKDILQSANYAKEADTHDPLNPIGLAASMFPFVLGGFAVRGAIKRMPAVKTEADMKVAATLSPSEQAASDAFERSAGNIAELRKAIAGEKRPDAKAVLQTELDTLLTSTGKDVRGAVAGEASTRPEAIDAARVQILDETLHRSLPNVPGAHAEMLRASNMVGAGERVSPGPLPIETLPDFMARAGIKREALPPEVKGDFIAFIKQAGGVDMAYKYDVTGERSGVLSNPGGIFRKGGRGLDDLALQAEAAGYLRPGEGQDSRLMAEMIQNTIRGDRVLTFEQQMQHAAREQHLSSQAERLAAIEGRLRLLGEDPAPADGNVAVLEAYANAREHQLLAVTVDDLSAAVRLADTEAALPERQPSRAQPAIDRANTALQDLQDSGKPVGQFLTDAVLPPEVHNLVLGLNKLDDAGRAKLLSDFDQAARTDQKMPLHDLAADVIEGKIKPKGPEQSPDAVMAQQIADLNPELAVRLPGDKANTTMAAALERIKAEQADDAGWADLYRVAVQCALTGGAATP